MVPFIGAGISLISGAIDNLFTGEGRERRQARRLARREKRAAKRAGRITVKQPAKKVAYRLPAERQPGQSDIKAARKPAGDWIKENWYFVAGGAVVVVLLFWMFGKKKKVGGRPRKKKSNPGSSSSSSSSSNPSKKSQGTFVARTRRVNREWKKAKASGSKIGRKAAWAKWG